MSRPGSMDERRLRSGLVRRAIATRAPLLAARLHDYAESAGLSWAGLAKSLAVTEEALDQVALCRVPRPTSYAVDVEAIAAGHVDGGRLLSLLRRIEVLAALRSAPGESPIHRPSCYEAGTAALLLAARDREDQPEGPEEPEGPPDPDQEEAPDGDA